MRNSKLQATFILSAAAAHLVQAYKKAISVYHSELPLELSVCRHAPSDYSTLYAEAKNQNILRVTDEFSETSIYGTSGNITFRIFHDYGHLMYRKQFTTEQEVELANIQWDDIAVHIPREWRKVCKVVYLADTVEQSLYESGCGEFPKDQKEFVLGFLIKHLEGL